MKMCTLTGLVIILWTFNSFVTMTASSQMLFQNGRDRYTMLLSWRNRSRHILNTDNSPLEFSWVTQDTINTSTRAIQQVSLVFYQFINHPLTFLPHYIAAHSHHHHPPAPRCDMAQNYYKTNFVGIACCSRMCWKCMNNISECICSNNVIVVCHMCVNRGIMYSTVDPYLILV